MADNAYVIEVWGRHDRENCKAEAEHQVYPTLSSWSIAFRRQMSDVQVIWVEEEDSFMEYPDQVLRFRTPPNLWDDLVTNSQHPATYGFEPPD